MTAPLPSSPLVEALIAMVQAAIPTCGVHWAGVPDGTRPPYAVFYPDTGMDSTADRALSDDVPTDLRYQVTSVGESVEQAVWVADKVDHALLTGIPTVDGRRVRPTRKEGSQPVQRDDEFTDLWFATNQYVTRSERT